MPKMRWTLDQKNIMLLHSTPAALPVNSTVNFTIFRSNLCASSRREFFGRINMAYGCVPAACKKGYCAI